MSRKTGQNTAEGGKELLDEQSGGGLGSGTTGQAAGETPVHPPPSDQNGPDKPDTRTKASGPGIADPALQWAGPAHRR